MSKFDWRKLYKFDYRHWQTWARLLAILAVFYFILQPCHTQGPSMLPTYSESTFGFCFKPAFWFRAPHYGEIAVLKLVDGRYLLKRILGLPGDTIAFKNGALYRNGVLIREEYVKKPGNWTLPERRVEPGCIYVAGDNRALPIDEHVFGQISQKRLTGKLLW